MVYLLEESPQTILFYWVGNSKMRIILNDLLKNLFLAYYVLLEEAAKLQIFPWDNEILNTPLIEIESY